MKNPLIYLFALMLIAFTVSSCKKDLNSPNPVAPDSTFSADYARRHPTTPTAPTTPTSATGPTVNVGDGSSNLTVDGSKYVTGTIVVVKAGTYNKGSGITLQNCTGLTIQGTGVVIDGTGAGNSGYYNCLQLSNLTNTTVSGFTIQNNGYYPVYFNTKMTGLVLDGIKTINCGRNWYIQNNLTWDGTDNTAVMLNCAFRNCVFNNATFLSTNGGINGNVVNYIKNIEISNCSFSNYDGGDLLQLNAVDGFKIFNNTVKNINSVSNLDNRLFMVIGNGDAYNNTFDTYEGHAIGLNPVSFGGTLATSHFHDNTFTNSRRYAAVEMQEFSWQSIPGKTSVSNLEVTNNTAGNLNTDKWTGYPATFIDNYQGYNNGMGCKTTLTNNKGYNWFPVPTNSIYWNLAQPTVATGNTYSASM